MMDTYYIFVYLQMTNPRHKYETLNTNALVLSSLRWRDLLPSLLSVRPLVFLPSSPSVSPRRSSPLPSPRVPPRLHPYSGEVSLQGATGSGVSPRDHRVLLSVALSLFRRTQSGQSPGRSAGSDADSGVSVQSPRLHTLRDDETLFGLRPHSTPGYS